MIDDVITGMAAWLHDVSYLHAKHRMYTLDIMVYRTISIFPGMTEYSTLQQCCWLRKVISLRNVDCQQ